MANEIKVGDLVAWEHVPNSALARDADGCCAIRQNDRGSWVGDVSDDNGEWSSWDGCWRWVYGTTDNPVTIVALNVPANATAEQLRELAERFEVRDAVLRDASLWANLEPGEIEACAADLHRAGWRPGMTAEDAARLLAEVQQ